MFTKDIEAMEEGNDTEAPEQFPVPNFVSYNVIMLAFFVIPVTVVNTITIAGLILDKVTPIPIRLVIANLLGASLIVIFGLYLEHLTSLALIGGNNDQPPREFCSFIIWLLAGGGASRLVFTAVFSIIVFVIVKGSAKAVSKVGLAISIVVLWIVTFLLSAPTLSLNSVGVHYLGGAACFPRVVEGVTNPNINRIFVILWAILFGIIPLVITVTMPLVTIWFLKRHNTSGDMKFKKAMVKFALFLILGILFNFLGQVVPPIIALANESIMDSSLVYLAFILMNLSLIPTPVLIYVYLGGVRTKVKELLLCYPIRFRGESARERSSGSVLSKRGSNIKLSKQPTNISVISDNNKAGVNV